jgi:hypothetical protein
MTRGDDVAQSLGPTEPKWDRPAPPPWPAGQVLASFQFCFANVSRRVGARGIWCPKSKEAKLGGRPAGHVYGWPASVCWVTTTNQQWSSLDPPINTPHTPFGEIEIIKWGLASYSAPKFILCRVEREGGKVLRAGGLPGMSGVLRVVRALKFCQNMFGFDGVFWARSVECGSSARIMWILMENRLSSRSSVLESRLVGIILRHCLGVGDLPIIVNYSFAALMLFVHLHTV